MIENVENIDTIKLKTKKLILSAEYFLTNSDILSLI